MDGTTDGKELIAYDMMVNGVGERTSNIKNSIQFSYDNGITDEFIRPLVHVDRNNEKVQKSKMEMQ